MDTFILLTGDLPERTVVLLCLKIKRMIRPLTSADAQAFVDLRKQSFSTDPLSWDYEPGTTVDVETWAPRLVETDNEVVFGYFSEGESGVLQLTGVIVLQRFSKLKRSHRAMVWGVYVSPAARGRGVRGPRRCRVR